MTTIVTRAGKGSPLTNNEVDANFTNLNDAKIETLTSTDTSVTITGTGSSRNLSVPVNPNVVSGPASATDNAITRFDTTTGKLVQNSTVTLDDNGNIINVNSLALDTTPATVPATVGTMSWDDGEGMPAVLLKGGNSTLQVGAQEYARVYNDSGSILTKGQAVYIFGAQGNRISVKLARADVEATSYGTLGLVSETIGIGAEGYILVSGALYKLNTLGLTAGAPVYLSPITAGAVTTTKPQAPQQLVIIGFVERVDATVGSIYVKVDNGYEIDELHDVRITSPVSGNLLIYDATTSPIGVWKNANLTAGTGISVTNGAASISIANTGVTSVTGTSPVASSGGATPAISLAANYGDTQNPYASKTANNFLAAPNGAAGAPTFRAIVAADIPTLNQNTTGSSGSCTGNAATATTATNQSGGTVNATTGAFSSTVTFAGGSKIESNGDIHARRSSGATGVVYFGANTGGSIYLYYDGTNFNFSGGNVYASTFFGDLSGNATTATTATTASTANALNAANSYTAVSFTATSDERLKTNWAGLSLDFVALLANVKHGTFERISDGTRDVGVSAQSLQKIIPEAVVTNTDGYLSVNYGGAALVAAIELAKVVEELRAEVARLKIKVGE